MTVVAILAVCVGVWLWVREWRRPPVDRAARRRLMAELARHNTELFESEDAA